MNTLKTIRRFLIYLKPYWQKGLFAFCFMFLSILLQLPLPFLSKYLIDKVITLKSFSILNIIGIVLLAVLFLQSFSSFVEGYLLTIFRAKVIFDIKLKLFEHLQKLSMSFFHNKKTGYLMSRVSDDVEAAKGLLADTLISFSRDTLIFLVGICCTLYIHPKLALISFSILPLYIFSMALFNNRIRKMSHQVRESYAQTQKELQELLCGIAIIKAFNREKGSAIRLVNSMKRLIKINVRLEIISSLAGIIAAIISSLGPMVLIWYGCAEIMKGNLTVGGLIAFNSFLRYLFNPAREIFNLNVGIQRSLAACERIFEILDIKTEEGGKKELKIEKGEIVFDNISFSYNGTAQVLKEISFRVTAGEIVALVGRSGAGKTTLLNLLPRFYKPQEGRILIDGKDTREVRLDSLRRNIGIVAQETFLFSDSIRENIRFSKRNASESEIIQAIKLARVDEFAEALPEQYETKVGERGVKLSGGERQRIAIARAILRNPKILILDEATSQLDSGSERYIQEALASLMKDRTTFVIAHRLSTILNADKILVLDDGRIVGEGTHDELYKNCKVYKELYNEQFKRNSK